ncbi:hypothetical protein DFH07DRAFT_963855 [Mycena maculata]|uniref:F-box domain-containing protein n=1 Tax=Mycena maculata TaxID=230809 RepID=A0AAD7N4F6_9AGAR|nr:hypothetical protein DFH07DRAFT_963855 [Mycena maculata]
MSGYSSFPETKFMLQPSASLTKAVHPPSISRKCPEDVLKLIFIHCPDPTLASAAVVCTSWTAPAQHALLSVLPTERERRFRILPSKRDIHHFGWVCSLPQEGLLLLKAFEGGDAADCTDGREVSEVILYSSAICNVRCLSHLGLGILDTDAKPAGTLCPRSCGSPTIRSTNLFDSIPNLVRACSTGLQRLDLRILRMESHQFSVMTDVLLGVPQLPHLRLDWADSTRDYLDEMVTHLPKLPNLRHL